MDEVFHLPLFLDTVFTAAIVFSAGLLPGIVTALLTAALSGLRHGTPEINIFVLCSITEVILVWIFRRRFGKSQTAPAGPAFYSLIAAASSLLLLALSACVIISVLGGLIDSALFLLVPRSRPQFSPEDGFRLGLLRNGIPLLWSNILARFPVNLVDRFIVIFGAYGVSRLILKIFRPAPKS
jgi:uncharacterized membrane protein